MDSLDIPTTPDKLINPLLWAILAAFLVFLASVFVSVFQIDDYASRFERNFAQTLATRLAGESDETIVQTFADAGFSAAEISGVPAQKGQIGVPLLTAEGLRRGTIVFSPQRPGLNTFQSTIGYKLPFLVISLAIVTWFLVRLKHHTRILEARRKKARRMALTDGLTGIANRTLFNAKLDKWLSQDSAEREDMALYFIDIDNFKSVNDRFGHGVGDALLVHMAKVAQTISEPDDLVARLAGDEFAILRAAPGDARQAMAFAERLVQRMNGRIRIENVEVDTSISVGVALARPIDVIGRNAYCRNADMALYAAKRSGRNGAALFSEVTENMLHAPGMLKSKAS